jgi:hypothetical protein
MRDLVTSSFVTLSLLSAAACTGQVSAASVTNLDVQFEPPRSIGTPAAELARLAGATGSQIKSERR